MGTPQTSTDMKQRHFFLVTYRPLNSTKAGREAINALKLLPYVDGSIRREPDFEHAFPAITCLCRTDKFVPRLAVGDVVGYLAAKHRYEREKTTHWRLTAVLEVLHVCATHRVAAEWYAKKGLSLPSNIMIPGNPPKPIEQSHRMFSGREGCGSGGCGDSEHSAWDDEYKDRAKTFPKVAICRRLFKWLKPNPPRVSDAIMKAAFNGIPGTQCPGYLEEEGFRSLLLSLGITVRL